MDDDHIRDIFAGLGPVTIKRMFGGKSVYHQGLILAVVIDGDLLLKADKTSAPDFEAAGAVQWVYEGKNKTAAMPYWSIPDDAVDDPDELNLWTRKAFEAAVRAGK